MKREMNNKGFSLVELIIVIAIMAILVGVMAPQFMKYIESSRQSTDIQNASSVRSAVEAYVAETATSTNITVKVGGGSIATSGDSGLSTALEDVGLSASIATKSSGWGASAADVATYNVTTYKWNTSTASNAKKPGKHLEDAFK